MIIVSGDREGLRAVTIERTRTLLAEAWPAIEAGLLPAISGGDEGVDDQGDALAGVVIGK